MADSSVGKERAGVEFITQTLMRQLCGEAGVSQRGRTNYNFHKSADFYQRLLNVIQPNSYITPHRHLTPPKSESFIVLKGEIAFFSFDDNGALIDSVRLGPDNEMVGVDLNPGIWHTFFALKADTVVFEGKNGPYDPTTDKTFAPWAPAEGSAEAEPYLNSLLSRLSPGRGEA